jgi:hypothetical protein
MADEALEVDVTYLNLGEGVRALGGAIDAAGEYGTRTWLVDDGKRVAAIVPVEHPGVLSPRVLADVQAEADKAHAKHGDQSLLGDQSDGRKLAALMEEGGEAAEVGLVLALMASIGKVGRSLTYDQQRTPADLYKELIQTANVALTWAEKMRRDGLV